MKRTRLIILLIGLFVGNKSGVSRGQDHVATIDTVAVERAVDAKFIDARSVALDPSGRIYVVDAGRNTVSAFDSEGNEIGTFGGTGTNAGQFDEPTDLDPTNGLILNVADAGNGRILRYSRDFRFLESLPVPTSVGQQRSEAPSFRPGSERVEGLSDGRPISVATSRADDLFVIESSSGSVFKWDRDRRNSTVIGQSPDESASIRRPVDLAVSGDLLYVADSDSKAIIVFDLFGVYQRKIQLSSDRSVRAVKVTGESILVVFEDRIQCFSLSGSYQATRIPKLRYAEPIVDIAAGQKGVYILTRQQLYSISNLETTN